jgi:death-on-curing protein
VSRPRRNSSPTSTPKRSIDLAAERPVEFLDLDDLIDLARIVLGDPPPVRDVGLLASAVARPQTSFGGENAYPTVWLKAAALLESVVGNHALVDGNKRLGWIAVAVFLEVNEVRVATATNDDVYTLVMDVARSQIALDEIAERLRHLVD